MNIHSHLKNSTAVALTNNYNKKSFDNYHLQQYPWDIDIFEFKKENAFEIMDSGSSDNYQNLFFSKTKDFQLINDCSVKEALSFAGAYNLEVYLENSFVPAAGISATTDSEVETIESGYYIIFRKGGNTTKQFTVNLSEESFGPQPERLQVGAPVRIFIAFSSIQSLNAIAKLNVYGAISYEALYNGAQSTSHEFPIIIGDDYSAGITLTIYEVGDETNFTATDDGLIIESIFLIDDFLPGTTLIQKNLASLLPQTLISQLDSELVFPHNMIRFENIEFSAFSSTYTIVDRTKVGRIYLDYLFNEGFLKVGDVVTIRMSADSYDYIDYGKVCAGDNCYNYNDDLTTLTITQSIVDSGIYIELMPHPEALIYDLPAWIQLLSLEIQKVRGFAIETTFYLLSNCLKDDTIERNIFTYICNELTLTILTSASDWTEFYYSHIEMLSEYTNTVVATWDVICPFNAFIKVKVEVIPDPNANGNFLNTIYVNDVMINESSPSFSDFPYGNMNQIFNNGIANPIIDSLSFTSNIQASINDDLNGFIVNTRFLLLDPYRNIIQDVNFNNEAGWNNKIPFVGAWTSILTTNLSPSKQCRNLKSGYQELVRIIDSEYPISSYENCVECLYNSHILFYYFLDTDALWDYYAKTFLFEIDYESDKSIKFTDDATGTSVTVTVDSTWTAVNDKRYIYVVCVFDQDGGEYSYMQVYDAPSGTLKGSDTKDAEGWWGGTKYPYLKIENLTAETRMLLYRMFYTKNGLISYHNEYMYPLIHNVSPDYAITPSSFNKNIIGHFNLIDESNVIKNESNKVTKWNNIITNSTFNFTQSNTNLAPVYTLSGSHDIALQFAGSNSKMSLTANPYIIEANTDFNIIIIFNPNNSNGQLMSNGTGLYFQLTGNQMTVSYIGFLVQVPISITSKNYMLSVSRKSGVMRVDINNTNNTNNTSQEYNGAESTFPLYIGEGTTMKIHEIIFYKESVLTNLQYMDLYYNYFIPKYT